MHRIDVPSATPENLFTEGSPSGGVPATTVAADWLNDLQENVCEVIEAAGITLEKGNFNQLLLAIQSIGGRVVGEIVSFPFTTPPTGWIKCNGQAVSRTTYANLFVVIGTTFGAGNGTTTFNVPDLRAMFVRGLDEGRGLDAARALGSTQTDAIRDHEHRFPLGDGGGGGTVGNLEYDATANAGTVGLPMVAGTAGPETRPRNVALVFYIKH